METRKPTYKPTFLEMKTFKPTSFDTEKTNKHETFGGETNKHVTLEMEEHELGLSEPEKIKQVTLATATTLAQGEDKVSISPKFYEQFFT